MTVKSPRLAAFETLYKIQQESAYSNLSLDHLPVANGQERAFATALVRGVLERQITLDALVDKFTTGRLKPKVPGAAAYGRLSGAVYGQGACACCGK